MGEKIEDMGEGMQCSDHPYRNNPGGICAFCLQEKLGKLVSSSKSNSFCPVPAPSSSSSSPSRSDYVSATAVGGVAVVNNTNINVGGRTQIPFFAHKKKKVISSDAGALVLKRSRSVAVPRHHCTDDSPRLRRGFWSFLSRRAAKPHPHHHQQQPSSPGGRKDDAGGSTGDENESPNSSSHASSSFGRKVARSRSVGCGSRSFSGDFLERISTGLGDCALRRVESQREAKPKIVLHRSSAAADDRIKEKVKCGGIFGMMGGSSSSSYWVSDDFNGRISQGGGATPHGRSKSWGWAFASPMRAFRPSSTKSSSSSYISASSSDNINNNKANGTTTSDGRRPGDQNHHKIDASPSLLAVRT